MLNTLFQSPYCYWITSYTIALALLSGWLVFEKIPTGQQELAVSVENAFRGNAEVMEKSNVELLHGIQDGAEDYPSPQSVDYKNRAEKVWVLAGAFKNNIENEQIGLLQSSFVMLADSNAFTQHAAAEFINTKLASQYLDDYKGLKASQLLVQLHGLVTLNLNYCATKIAGTDSHCWGWNPDFLPSTCAPMAGDTFQAEIALSGYYNPRCANWYCWLNDQPLPLRDGVAHLNTTFPTSGTHSLHIRFRRERCRDGSVTEVSRDFQVNVLERCGSIPTR